MAKKLETLTKEQLIAKLREAKELNEWYADFHEYCFNNGNRVATQAVEYADDQEKAREYKI
tara:strand:- start:631 stop:813 length:183 start_codon:yes stop_codon:yes gene_type:complete